MKLHKKIKNRLEYWRNGKRLTDRQVEKMRKWADEIYAGQECESFVRGGKLRGGEIYWENFYLITYGYVPAKLKDYFELHRRYKKFRKTK